MNALTLRFLCAFSCLFAANFSGCKRAAPASTPSPQILRLSQRNEPSDLDPATATLADEFFIIRALSEGLVSPSFKTSRGSFKRRFQLFIGEFLEFLQDLAGGRIDTLVAHAFNHRRSHASGTWGVHPIIGLKP